MKKAKNTRYIVLILITGLVVFIGFRLGIYYESKVNLNKDKELIVRELIGDFYTVSFLMQHWTEQLDESNESMIYIDDYNRILREVEELKGTLELSDMILYSDGYSIPFHQLSDSIEISFSIFEGVELNGDKISNDFFDDNVINESESMYIKELSSDIEMIVISLKGTLNSNDDKVDFTIFHQTLEIFTDKYQIGEELYDLVVDN